MAFHAWRLVFINWYSYNTYLDLASDSQSVHWNTRFI